MKYLTQKMILIYPNEYEALKAKYEDGVFNFSQWVRDKMREEIGQPSVIPAPEFDDQRDQLKGSLTPSELSEQDPDITAEEEKMIRQIITQEGGRRSYEEVKEEYLNYKRERDDLSQENRTDMDEPDRV